ncbi:hypothetical protein SAMN05421670_0575 [Psychrobacillus psychrotolerans]|uniref:Uncharacterized protein n=1 Tax=Psychrobacillus psychrotolerans TaxID=126156 RepID=A0A1I5UWT9_9BACI|nr:hypothetical protein [Psychrobacillus psychrotolerans]SFP99715.1 hypothetical protein SAMN05421670_0575 [Psychrobacillus psychrotolerans]
MDLLLWITTGFMLIGLVVLVTMKKGMESKVAFIKANMDKEENSSKAKSVIWWIRSTTAWGVGGIFLVVWWFNNYFG